MNKFCNAKIINYIKFSILSTMLILGLFFKAFVGDYILLLVLVLIEFVFRLGFKYINLISHTISNKIYKSILRFLNILTFEFEFLFVYLFFNSIFKFNMIHFTLIISFISFFSVLLFSLFVLFNIKYEILIFRPANESDRDAVLEIYLDASNSLKKDGVDQWQGKYVPSFKDFDEHLGVDLYVLEYHKTIVSTVCLVEGIDEDYENINGKWNTEIPYLSIHKVATSKRYKKQSFGKKMMIFVENFAKNKKMDLRIDTHRDNNKMRNFILSCGYKYTGEVILQGELKRLGYDKKIL